MRHDFAVIIDKLTEDKTNTEEETAHHVAIAALYEVDDLQSLPGFPAAEQQHDQADEVGCCVFSPNRKKTQHHLIYNKV